MTNNRRGSNNRYFAGNRPQNRFPKPGDDSQKYRDEAINFRELRNESLRNMGMNNQTRWELLKHLCPLDEDPMFDFSRLTKKHLREMQTYYRNPTLAKQSYVALQYGINATIAMVVGAISTELDRRT